jgi:ubiquinone/menaquinone biosynthesis C-methylase UbiE
MEMKGRLKLFVNSPLWPFVLRRIIARRLLRRLAELRPERVLEIGCGRGDTTRWLLDLYPHASVTAVDYDGAQIGAARRRVADARASFVRADASALPFPADAFDLVVAMNVMHHVIPWRRAIAECYRVLEPGGAFAAVDEDMAALGPVVRWYDAPEAIIPKAAYVAAAKDAGFVLEADLGGRGVYELLFRAPG